MSKHRDLEAPWRGTTSSGTKGKGRASPRTNSDLEKITKSRPVRQLENLIRAIENGHPTVKYEGCFCRARKHDLSPYTSLCLNCGLVLCVLQHPALPCPSCHRALLGDTSRASVLAKLESKLASVLAQEAAAHEKERFEQEEREIAAAGGGAFPVLVSGSTTPTGRGSSTSSTNTIPNAQPRKVLSLNPKTKKATISTISRVPIPSPSIPLTQREKDEALELEMELEDVVSREERKTRIPPPPLIPDHSQKIGIERRWENIRPGAIAAMYVQPPRVSINENAGASSLSIRKKKAKSKAKEGAPLESV